MTTRDQQDEYRAAHQRGRTSAGWVHIAAVLIFAVGFLTYLIGALTR